jgi:hypothetical protein
VSADAGSCFEPCSAEMLSAILTWDSSVVLRNGKTVVTVVGRRVDEKGEGG